MVTIRKFSYLLLLHCTSVFAQLSPYGTGFSLGSKEDLEIRFEWAKRNPCFVHGFSESSKEYLDLKVFWMKTYGQLPTCNIKKETNKPQAKT